MIPGCRIGVWVMTGKLLSSGGRRGVGEAECGVNPLLLGICSPHIRGLGNRSHFPTLLFLFLVLQSPLISQQLPRISWEPPGQRACPPAQGHFPSPGGLEPCEPSCLNSSQRTLRLSPDARHGEQGTRIPPRPVLTTLLLPTKL